MASPFFDRLGVRIITEDRFDTLLVIRNLRMTHVIMFVNVVPGRSRNTLFHLPALEPQARMLDAAVAEGAVTPTQRLTWLREAVAKLGPPEPGADEENRARPGCASVLFPLRGTGHRAGQSRVDPTGRGKPPRVQGAVSAKPPRNVCWMSCSQTSRGLIWDTNGISSQAAAIRSR